MAAGIPVPAGKEGWEQALAALKVRLRAGWAAWHWVRCAPGSPWCLVVHIPACSLHLPTIPTDLTVHHCRACGRPSTTTAPTCPPARCVMCHAALGMLCCAGGSRPPCLLRASCCWRLRAGAALTPPTLPLTMCQVGISFDDVRMAVLCQRVVPAQVSLQGGWWVEGREAGEQRWAAAVLRTAGSAYGGAGLASPEWEAAWEPGAVLAVPLLLLLPNCPTPSHRPKLPTPTVRLCHPHCQPHQRRRGGGVLRAGAGPGRGHCQRHRAWRSADLHRSQGRHREPKGGLCLVYVFACVGPALFRQAWTYIWNPMVGGLMAAVELCWAA